jgi:23S rRNA (uridine2552-2'-O)-methyltransferase
VGAGGEPARRISGKRRSLKAALVWLEAQPLFRLGFFFPPVALETPIISTPFQMTYRPHDRYYKKAKQEGYRSRAAYKLLDLQQRYRLLRPGDKVVDLGAAPGGWLQVGARIIGQSGRIIGVDLQEMAPFPERNVTVLRGDASSGEVQSMIVEVLAGPAGVVISDMAPKLSGIRDADIARAVELNRLALAVAIRLLRPGGSLLVKSFMSNELHHYTAELKRHFSNVQRTKPEATRQGSSEFYFLAKSFLAPGGSNA